MAVTLTATFTKDTKEFDGVGARSDDIVEAPHLRRVVIGVIECTNIDTDILRGGAKTPKMRLVTWEVVEGDDELTARKMHDAAYHERTGKAAPPPTLFDNMPPPMQDGPEESTGEANNDEPPWDDEDPPPPAAEVPAIADPAFSSSADEQDGPTDEVAAKRGGRRK